MGLVVYRDDPAGNPQAFFELTPVGQAGLLRWRAQNCNVCHQLYGFGGYLGPDLTHVAERVDQASFLQILRAGTGPMPAFSLSDEEATELYAFLAEMGRSGQGHLSSGRSAAVSPRAWDAIFTSLAAEGHAAGIEVFERLECGTCHQPFRLGKIGAPDLSRTAERMSEAMMDAILRHGRGNMPFFGLNNEQVAALCDLLRALNARRASLMPTAPRRPTVPWFNYERPDAAAPQTGESK